MIHWPHIKLKIFWKSNCHAGKCDLDTYILWKCTVYYQSFNTIHGYILKAMLIGISVVSTSVLIVKNFCYAPYAGMCFHHNSKHPVAMKNNSCSNVIAIKILDIYRKKKAHVTCLLHRSTMDGILSMSHVHACNFYKSLCLDFNLVLKVFSCSCRTVGL